LFVSFRRIQEGLDTAGAPCGRRIFPFVASKWLVQKPWLIILIIALFVRLPGLASRPLWYDEAFAVLFSSKGPSAMLYGTLAVEGNVAADVHPLAYYTLLWLWGCIFGTSPLAVRSLSLLMGLGVIMLGFILAKRMFCAQTAILAGWILALSPFQVHYAQEVRMYGLLAILLLAATLVYWEALQGAAVLPWLAFGLLAAAAQYTHNLACLYLLALCLTPIILRRWRALAQTFLAGLLAVMIYLPWLLRLPSQVARVQWAYWISTPGLTALVRTLLVFVSGMPVPLGAMPQVLYKAFLACLLFVTILVIVIAAWATVRAVCEEDVFGRRAAWLAYLASGPVLLMFLISQWQPIYLDRAMLPAGAVFCLWLAWALRGTHLPRRMLITGMLGLAMAFTFGLFGFYTYSGFPYAPYKDLDSYLDQQLMDGEVILHSNKVTALPAIYYDQGLDHHYLADPPGTGSDTLALATQQVLGLLADKDVATVCGDAEGVWFVIFPREVEDYRSFGVEEHPALSWLQAQFKIAEIRSFGELKLYHFVH